MKLKIFFLSLGLVTLSAFPLEGIYVGGEIGNVALTGTTSSSYNNAIGFGLDLGFRTNPLLDVALASQYSAHEGGASGLKVFAQNLVANFHILEANDFDLSLGTGPGFYFFKDSVQTTTCFGLEFGGNVDVRASEGIRVGLGAKYHTVFNKAPAKSSDLWSVMMRVGYQFGE